MFGDDVEEEDAETRAYTEKAPTEAITEVDDELEASEEED